MIRLVASDNDVAGEKLITVSFETDADYELLLNAMLSSVEYDFYGHSHDRVDYGS